MQLGALPAPPACRPERGKDADRSPCYGKMLVTSHRAAFSQPPSRPLSDDGCNVRRNRVVCIYAHRMPSAVENVRVHSNLLRGKDSSVRAWPILWSWRHSASPKQEALRVSASEAAPPPCGFAEACPEAICDMYD